MEKNYEFTGETKEIPGGITLKRIRCTKAIPIHRVCVGDIGGWIEKEDNLSDNAWVSDKAKVFGDARVFGNARLRDYARVFGNAKVANDAKVFDYARVSDNALVADDADIFGYAKISENANVHDNAKVGGSARIYGNAKVYGNAIVSDTAKVFGYARVFGDAWVKGGAWEQSPLYIQGSKCALYVASKTEIGIGFQIHSVDDWRESKNWREIAKAYNMDDATVQKYIEHFNLAVRQYGLGDEIRFEPIRGIRRENGKKLTEHRWDIL